MPLRSRPSGLPSSAAGADSAPASSPMPMPDKSMSSRPPATGAPSLPVPLRSRPSGLPFSAAGADSAPASSPMPMPDKSMSSRPERASASGVLSASTGVPSKSSRLVLKSDSGASSVSPVEASKPPASGSKASGKGKSSSSSSRPPDRPAKSSSTGSSFWGGGGSGSGSFSGVVYSSFSIPSSRLICFSLPISSKRSLKFSRFSSDGIVSLGIFSSIFYSKKQARFSDNKSDEKIIRFFTPYRNYRQFECP